MSVRDFARGVLRHIARVGPPWEAPRPRMPACRLPHCACGHHKTPHVLWGRCMGRSRRSIACDTDGRPVAWSWAPCECVEYRETPTAVCALFGLGDHGSHAHGGQCQAEVRRLRNGCTSTYDWVPCACLVYDGPEPLPRVWTELPGGTDG